MKVRLRLNEETKKKVMKELISSGWSVDEDAGLILTEEDYREETLTVKDDGVTVVLPIGDICFIESLGHDVYVNTAEKQYRTDRRLYKLEAMLPQDRFIRISNSVIIRKNAVRKVRMGLSCRYHLTLEGGVAVDVTRTYYYKFKEYYGI